MVQTKVPVRLLGAPRAGLANSQATTATNPISSPAMAITAWRGEFLP